MRPVIPDEHSRVNTLRFRATSKNDRESCGALLLLAQRHTLKRSIFMAAETFLLIDGTSIDRTLANILGHRPAAAERPAWDRVINWVRTHFDGPCHALFFRRAPNPLPDTLRPFVIHLRSLGIHPCFLDGGTECDDAAIKQVLQSLTEDPPAEPVHVILATHDGGYLGSLKQVRERGGTASIIGFKEMVSRRYERAGLPVFDLESDVGAFGQDAYPQGLPRTPVVPIAMFDARKVLARTRSVA